MLLPLSFFLLIFVIFWTVLYFIVPEIWRGVDAIGRLLARRFRSGVTPDRHHPPGKWRMRLPIILTLTIGLAISFFVAEEFYDIFAAIQQKNPRLQDVDESTSEVFSGIRTTPATTFFRFVTDAGSPVGLSVIAAIMVVTFLVRRRYTWAAYLVVTMGGGMLMNQGLKIYFARARPELSAALKSASGYSFPSGHTMGAMVFFAAVSYLAFRGMRSWRSVSLTVAFSLTCILAIALSRVYLGVHWISDIGGGLLAGVLWATTTTIAYETLRRMRIGRRTRAVTTTHPAEPDVESARQADDTL